MSKHRKNPTPELATSMMILASGYAFSSLLIEGGARGNLAETRALLRDEKLAERNEILEDAADEVESSRGRSSAKSDDSSLVVLNAEYGTLAVS